MIKHRKIQVGLIILVLFLVALPAVAIVCGQPAGSGCGGYGLNVPGYQGGAPSCNQCACFCGWFECCTPPGAGGPHLAFLWDGVRCGCPTIGGSSDVSAGSSDKGQGASKLTQEEMQKLLKADIGKDFGDCKAYVRAKWIEQFKIDPGETMGDLMNGAVPYKQYIASGNVLKTGDMLFSPIEVGPTSGSGWHSTLFFSPTGGDTVRGVSGLVIADPGMNAGAVKFSNFGYYAPQIKHVRPAPY
ncbi:MAG: hypothetical protein HY813_01520 [Candidatus Portnoybacteria bacterium]|nr:hypothetical protein [Candidatus Portnoybacteria bacterium]